MSPVPLTATYYSFPKKEEPMRENQIMVRLPARLVLAPSEAAQALGSSRDFSMSRSHQQGVAVVLSKRIRL